MFKTMMVAGALSVGLVLASPVGPARADADVDIGIGLGGGYGSNPYYWQARRYISCREGSRIVFNAGFKNVRAVDCSGSQYGYMGRRGDRYYRISVRARNGNITQVQRIRRDGGWGGGYGGGWGGGYGGGYGDDYDGYGDDYYDYDY